MAYQASKKLFNDGIQNMFFKVKFNYRIMNVSYMNYSFVCNLPGLDFGTIVFISKKVKQSNLYFKTVY